MTTSTSASGRSLRPRHRRLRRGDLERDDPRAVRARDCRREAGSPRAPMVVDTGSHTGRSPNDKFIVREPASEHASGGTATVSCRRSSSAAAGEGDGLPRSSRALRRRRLRRRRSCASHRGSCHHDAPLHAFSRGRCSSTRPRGGRCVPAAGAVLHAPALEALPEEDGTRTGTFIVLHPTRTEVLIGGTFYAARSRSRSSP